jgi:hypothetical protein
MTTPTAYRAMAEELAMSASPKKKYPFTPGPWIAHTEILTPGGLHVAGRSPSVRKDSHIVAGVGSSWTSASITPSAPRPRRMRA